MSEPLAMLDLPAAEELLTRRAGRALPRFLLVSEAAEAARCSTWTIRREIAEGRLRARRIGRLLRVLDEDLASWMRGER